MQVVSASSATKEPPVTLGPIQTQEAPEDAQVRQRAHRVLAIVPAYNEAGSIAAVVAEIRRAQPTVDVVVVDDGSIDATAMLAEKAGAIVLRMPFNVGIGGAVQTGYQFALARGYDVAVQVDGDGQHDPSELGKIVAPLIDGEADMAVGTRFRGERTYRAPLGRRIGIGMFARIVSVMVGHKVTDTTSGFRAVNRSGIRLFSREYPNDYPEVESIVLLCRHALTMTEVPVEMRERSAGTSSITFIRSVYYVVKVMLALLISLFRKPRALPEEL